MRASPRLVLLPLALSLAPACTELDGDRDREPSPTVAGSSVAPAKAIARPQIDGHAWPDKLVALTWDDGPDQHTLELASFLAKERVAATFFVVADWERGVSSDPGKGRGVFTSGHDRMPVLGRLVELGHRLGNHTKNHVLLDAVDPGVVLEQVRQNQRELDPFLTNELRVFRVPGGAWNATASDAIAGDRELQRLVGPIRWDVDRKDWERSLWCDSDHPEVECEHAGPNGSFRTKASVVAHRYLDGIEKAGHGVVLFHDRVGHVGSTYAIDIAEIVVPELRQRGFVFVAPVLHFGELALRAPSDASTGSVFGDLDGDGRDDLCLRSGGGFVCAISEEDTRGGADMMPHQTFVARGSDDGVAVALREHEVNGEVAIDLADVNGDGKAELCVHGPDGVACADNLGEGRFGRFVIHSNEPWIRAEHEDVSLHFADVDGDGKADVCGRMADGRLACAKSLGESFARATIFATDVGDDFDLADVDGDGKADLCTASARGVACALSNGHRFGKLASWSSDLVTADALHYGDVNGDGRADVCAWRGESVLCSFSTARGFTKPTVWMSGLRDDFRLVDVNGDGRADLCSEAADGLRCAMAP